uniref:Uncharacterized protein n=1 Tax=Anopheles maculatus TaxID=74869 RepID=A0A182T5F9_9DIPT
TAAQGNANAATCVSNAVDVCVSGATTTTTTAESGALGDIRSPQTPHTVVDTAVPSSSTFTGGSGSKYKSLVMITDDTSDADSSKSKSSNEHESSSIAAAPNRISSECAVANVVQVNVASSASPTTTTTTAKTVPNGGSSSAEDIVCVQSHDHDEITSSTEEYEKNPTLVAAGALTDLCNRHSPSVRSVPVMEGEHFRSENDVQVNSVDRSSDCDDFYQQMSGAMQQQVGGGNEGVGEPAGEKLVQSAGLKSTDETKQVYGNEMEHYDDVDGDDDDGGGADDRCGGGGGGGGMQTQIGNVTANENVTVTTGTTTLSAVICLEDGLADDDSWVEEISQDEEEFATTTATDSDLDDSSEEMSFSNDREEELRGYNRTAIDFTLHTIVEESCEDSEIESRGSDAQGRRRGRRNGRGDHGFDAGHEGDGDDGTRDPAHRLSASELEKYFFYGRWRWWY